MITSFNFQCRETFYRQNIEEYYNIRLTWQLPGIILADIDLVNDWSRQWPWKDFAFKVLKDKLFVSWLETKTRRQSDHSISNKVELFHTEYSLERKLAFGSSNKVMCKRPKAAICSAQRESRVGWVVGAKRGLFIVIVVLMACVKAAIFLLETLQQGNMLIWQKLLSNWLKKWIIYHFMIDICWKY